MSTHNIERTVKVAGLQYHYLDYGGEGPVLLMLHSLSANSHIFHGLIARGLAQSFRVIIPDLRGRGLSDKPAFDYSLESESKALAELMNSLQIDKFMICGHSFGGLLATFFTAHYPQRVEKLVILDAAVTLNPLTPVLIAYPGLRLLKGFLSWQDYVTFVRNAPFMTVWDASIMPFLRADVIEQSDGTILPRCSIADVTKAGLNIFTIKTGNWRKIFSSVRQPAMLIQAKDPFMHGQFIVQPENAIQTVALMHDCEHLVVDGNHITMLYADGASQIVTLLKEFCLSGKRRFTMAA